MNWEILISIVGCVGGWELIRYLLNWRSEKKKNEHEAAKSGHEADNAKVDVWKAMQDVYQQTIEDQRTSYNDIRQEREELRQYNSELRNRLNDMDDKVQSLQRDVARNGRMVEAMRPFLCYRTDCKERVRNSVIAESDDITAP